MNFLEALAAAAQRLLIATVACFVVGGLAQRRVEGVSLDGIEPVGLLIAGALLAWLVREIVRPRWRASRIRQTRVQLPTSGVDFVADAALIAIGIAFVSTGRRSPLLGFGLGFLVVPCALAVSRAVFWSRRPTAG